VGELVPIDQHQVGGLADRDRADMAAEGSGRRPADGRHAQYLARARDVLVDHSRHPVHAQYHAHFWQMSRSPLIPSSSSPIAVSMPRLSNVLSGATPLRSRKFELQLWQMRVPVAATRSRSASLSHTSWPKVRRGPRKPKRSIWSSAVLPLRWRAYSFWQAVSARCICIGAS